jgi:pantoate--beta-alanine ligase
MQSIASAWRRNGTRIGFVPTMGFLHEGHLSLIHRARKAAGPKGRVVVSIYVNPTQFSPTEDLSRYPRDFKRDRRLCAKAGTDVLFFPTDAQMYPGRDAGQYSTYVTEHNLSLGMEGASRPTHFRGVTTIVSKLFHLVQPDVAVFGAKDWQQAAVLRKMVQDLNFPLRMIVAPTVREPDGLALSSRNIYLTPSQRQQATCLWKAIQTAKRAVRTGGRCVPEKSLATQLTREIEQHPDARVDYLAFFDPTSLRPVSEVRRGTHFALAVRVGKTRLIDNARL